MARRDKDFLGTEVVSLEDAAVVGVVDGLIVDDKQSKVVGLLIDMGIYEAKAVAFADVVSVGDDAVMIGKASSVKPISQHPELESVLRRDVGVSDSLALSDQGDIVGATGDYYVDVRSGEIRGVELITGDDGGEQTYLVPIGGIVRVGADLVMFTADFQAQAVSSGDAL